MFGHIEFERSGDLVGIRQAVYLHAMPLDEQAMVFEEFP